MVFKSAQLEKKFQKEGYLVLPLLNAQEVEALQIFFKERYQIDFSGFHSTHFLKDAKLKEEVHQEIVAVLEGRLQEYLFDYKALFGNFMVKATGEFSQMPLHADWTYVDEDQFQSLGIWCPLVDTNQENGFLGVVPKSHLLKKNYRGPKIPTPFHDHNEYIIEHFGKLLKMNAGEVVIYDHRTLHFSPANKSKEVRPALNLVMVPAKAQLYHYFNKEHFPKMEKYEVKGSDFYINYTHFEAPNTDFLVGEIQDNWQPFSSEYLGKKLKKSKLEWFKTLFS
jgi:ectoine hydroxylase-related dioxygenase (phytanoyl-CoA dioxygenase family)